MRVEGRGGYIRRQAALLAAAALLLATGQARAADPQPSASPGVEADVGASRPFGPVGPQQPRDLSRAPLLQQPVVPPPPPERTPGPTTGGTARGGLGSASRGNAETGRRFALENCRPCHVVAPTRSPTVRFANAPPFSTIAAMREMTPLRLNLWLTNPHPTMPTLRLTADEAADVIAYIMTLRK